MRESKSARVSRCGLARAGTNNSSISSRIKRPPLPCARLTCVSLSFRMDLTDGGGLDELTKTDGRIVDRKLPRDEHLETG